jgi:5'-methylthioadenosine phosphorylase
VLVDQFVDRTLARERSFFGPSFVAHVSMTHPVCPKLVDAFARAAEAERIPCRRGGTYVVIAGPQFSTLAESNLYRAWGCDVVGMTNMPEAKLAREAELPYATVAMVTDYDCWHPDHDHVDVATVVRVLNENVAQARSLLTRVIPMLGPERVPSPPFIERALDNAIITAPDARDPARLEKIRAIAGRALGAR